MRITVVSAGDVTRDPAAPPLIGSLAHAEHDVTVVAPHAGSVSGHEVAVPRESGRRGGRSEKDRAAALGKAVTKSKPDVIHPIRQRDLPAAIAAKRGVIARGVGWRVPEARDIVELAPRHPAASQSTVTTDLHLFVPGERRAASVPAAGRHRGRSLALVYRHTPTSPGRYLAAAAERAGIDVRTFDAELDWNDIDDTTDAVVFVESPYPPASLSGTNPGVPVLFWVHHGEHHLNANLRLVERYGVDAVLLAHSWHLSHRFPVAVHRFPFAVAPELFTDEPAPFDARTVDVAMVGAGIERESPRYTDRFLRISDLRSEFPGRALFRSGLDPEAMAAIYSNARIVINDGGSRHYPITMRVFEAIGAGALLATDRIPGTDLLFAPGGHYVELSWTVPAHVRQLLDDPRTASKAMAAHDHARRYHTYDHRIDDLLEIAAITDHDDRVHIPLMSALDSVIDADVEVSTVAVFGDIEIELPDRELRNGMQWLEAGGSGRFDAAVVVAGEADVTKVAPAIRRYMYLVSDDAGAELSRIRQVRPDATAQIVGDVVRIDMGAPGYIVRNGATR